MEVDLKDDSKEYTVQRGAFLVVSCDVGNHGKYNETETVSWYVNSNLVEVGLLDLRVIYGEKQELSKGKEEIKENEFSHLAGAGRRPGIFRVRRQRGPPRFWYH